MSTVHDVSEDVDEILERDLSSLVLLKLLVQHQIGITEISDVEGVAHIPALGSEALSLNQGGVEVAESKEDALDLGVLVFDLVLGEVLPGSKHICLETIGGFLHQLDTPV
jgi:hypothetical protein